MLKGGEEIGGVCFVVYQQGLARDRKKSPSLSVGA